ASRRWTVRAPPRIAADSREPLAGCPADRSCPGAWLAALVVRCSRAVPPDRIPGCAARNAELPAIRSTQVPSSRTRHLPPPGTTDRPRQLQRVADPAEKPGLIADIAATSAATRFHR